jgi:TetR/AcrR family transcriptional regulator
MTDPLPTRRTRRHRGPGRPPGSQAPEGREALLRAARGLMAEKGLPRVTAREVAERAGVKPALVNYYFGGKDELLRAVTVQVASEMRQRLEQAVAGGGRFPDRLRAVVSSWVAAMAQDPYGPRLLIEQVLFGNDAMLDSFAEEFGRPNAAAIASLLSDGRAAGEIREVDPAFLIPALAGICIFTFLSAPIVSRVFGAPGDPEPAPDFADNVTELLLHGIAAPGGGAE